MDKIFCPGQSYFCPGQKIFCPGRWTRHKRMMLSKKNRLYISVNFSFILQISGRGGLVPRNLYLKILKAGRPCPVSFGGKNSVETIPKLFHELLKTFFCNLYGLYLYINPRSWPSVIFVCLYVSTFVCLIFSPTSHGPILKVSTFLEFLGHGGPNKIVCSQIDAD